MQLEKMDETFREKPTYFKYTMNGVEHEVKTLEEIEYGQVTRTATPEEDEDTPKDLPAVPVKTTTILPSNETIHIKDGQKGVSYHNLFAEHLRGATEIQITDPYVRKFYQIKNLFEFLRMVGEMTAVGDEVKVKLITVNDPDITDQEANLTKIEDSLQGSAVDFEYYFDDAKTMHGRHIETDTGWDIILDMGLDIFHPYDSRNPFSLAQANQEERQCKKFYVNYAKKF